MSLIQMRLFSQALNMFTPVNVILPQPRDAHRELQPLPTLYLLHGMGDDATAWMRKSCVECYALEHGLAVVMPDGGLSCYENMAHGGAYRDYICDELPLTMRKTFPLSTQREQNFIAGCSMGGFGALKLGLARPELWSKIGCFSAAHFEYRPDSPRNQAMLRRVYGNRLDEYEARIAADAQSVNAGSLPLSIWHCCGTEDALRDNALQSRAFFEGMGAGAIAYHFEMLPGRHDWALWDAAARRFLETLELNSPEVQLF